MNKYFNLAVFSALAFIVGITSGCVTDDCCTCPYPAPYAPCEVQSCAPCNSTPANNTTIPSYSNSCSSPAPATYAPASYNSCR